MKPETSFILYLYPPSRLLQERVASLARLGYDKGLGEKSQLKTECLQVSYTVDTNQLSWKISAFV